MRRYLPEALFFASAFVVLATLRLDAFGDLPGFLLVAVFVCLSMPYGAIASMFMIPAFALTSRNRSAVFVAPFLGFALAIGSFILYIFVSVLYTAPRTTELYWGGLWIIPLISIAFFVARRIRADRKVAIAYLGGAMFLVGGYFATPWVSDVVLVLLQGPSLRAEVDASNGRKRLATYDYGYGFLEAPERLLIYDRQDTTTMAVLRQLPLQRRQYTRERNCPSRGFRVIGPYYAVLIDCYKGP